MKGGGPDCVERERERVPRGWPTRWVDEEGRCSQIRFFLVFIYTYI